MSRPKHRGALGPFTPIPPGLRSPLATVPALLRTETDPSATTLNSDSPVEVMHTGTETIRIRPKDPAR